MRVWIDLRTEDIVTMVAEALINTPDLHTKIEKVVAAKIGESEKFERIAREEVVSYLEKMSVIDLVKWLKKANTRGG